MASNLPDKETSDFEGKKSARQGQQMKVTGDNDTTAPESHCDVPMSPVMKMVLSDETWSSKLATG